MSQPLPTAADRATTVLEVLRAVAQEVAACGPDSWHLRFADPSLPPAKCRIADGFLKCYAPVRGQNSPDHWESLCRNAALPPLTKFALVDQGRLLLCTEFPVDEFGPDAELIRQATTSWVDTMHHEHQSRSGQPALAIAEPADDPGRGEALLRLLELSQWPASRRASGRLFADLEIAGPAAQALILPTAAGPRVVVESHTWTALDAVSRTALGHLLLAAAAVVPLARPFASESPGRLAVGAEVFFASDPTPSEMSAALGALSVMGRLCGEELRVLGNASIAKEYLEVRGYLRSTQTTTERTDTYDQAIDHAPGGDGHHRPAFAGTG
jgi:hypothetical protein